MPMALMTARITSSAASSVQSLSSNLTNTITKTTASTVNRSARTTRLVTASLALKVEKYHCAPKKEAHANSMLDTLSSCCACLFPKHLRSMLMQLLTSRNVDVPNPTS